MTEPASTTGILAWIFANAKWLIGGAVGIAVMLAKLAWDYFALKRDVAELKKDVKEIKAQNAEQHAGLEAKVDKVLECSRDNGKKIAVLFERTKK